MKILVGVILIVFAVLTGTSVGRMPTENEFTNAVGMQMVRIEAGSFIGLAAATSSEITIANVTRSHMRMIEKAYMTKISKEELVLKVTEWLKNGDRVALDTAGGITAFYLTSP